VKAGQTLALLQPPFSDFLVKLVESEAEVARTGLAVELAELTYSRVQKLADQELKAAREREEADFALRSAKANQQSARAVQAAYQKAGASFVMRDQAPGPTGALPTVELKAPLSGLVTQVAATAGEHVPADRAIITILDPEWVHLEARLPEADVDRVATPGGGVYEFPHAPGEFHQLLADGAGRVVYFGPEVDAVTRTVPLIYEVNNASRRLRIGLALNLYLETARAEEALAIPESAVVDEEGRPIAFVQVSGELFDKRYLTLGLREGGFVEVKDGLSAGERVATRGAYAIRLASVSTSIPSHGHPH
jgi:RND family efflux transporter MFP subunit